MVNFEAVLCNKEAPLGHMQSCSGIVLSGGGARAPEAVVLLRQSC